MEKYRAGGCVLPLHCGPGSAAALAETVQRREEPARCHSLRCMSYALRHLSAPCNCSLALAIRPCPGPPSRGEGARASSGGRARLIPV